MSSYVILRQFSGSPNIGDVVNIPNRHRAQNLMSRRYLRPADDTEALLIEALTLVPLKALPALLNKISSEDIVMAAGEVDTRGNAADLYLMRLAQIGGNDAQ